MESLWNKRRCLGLAHLIDRTLARDSMIQSIGGARDARIAREVVAALRRASRGADVLPKARGQHARRGVKVSLSVDASLRAHEDSLLASGRWARVPETQATEKEEEEQEETVIVCGGGIASCDDDDQEEAVIVCGGPPPPAILFQRSCHRPLRESFPSSATQRSTCAKSVKSTEQITTNLTHSIQLFEKSWST